ncbi:hypothetical protein [Plastoroseomonas hellenica]|uniref:hypothetical protein n=1 Tax=Plastoroseomonas hellenica TaxID=2687306 RepID=UPI001BA8A5BB|nr:hypothetical protein [Plastoroseomonas hellenica]MBR0641709.1 hypothetical protein [Plastoroseomonas hellenica]
MVGIAGITKVLGGLPDAKRAQPEARRERPAAERCPKCGHGHLRFDREVPAAAPGQPARRYYRCTAPDCEFESMAGPPVDTAPGITV